MKILYKKSTSNIPDGERLNSFLQISGIREDFWLSPLVLNIVLRVLASAVKQEKETKLTVWEKSESTFSHRQRNYLNVRSKGICKNVTRKKKKES